MFVLPFTQYRLVPSIGKEPNAWEFWNPYANIKKQNEGKKRTVDEENIQGMLEKHDTLAMIISALITICQKRHCICR